MGSEASRLVRMPRGHPEALTDAWTNLYAEFAVAIAARRAKTSLPPGLVRCPDALDGARGVRFVEAAVKSAASGAWEECELRLGEVTVDIA